MRSRLGTQLRHLLELCDSGVAQSYRDAGLEYIPRFTPIVRALQAREPLTIGEIAAAACITQPAATQTVALMIKSRLLSVRRGSADARQRVVRLSRHARSILPQLEQCWDATAVAHAGLEKEISIPLSAHLDHAIEALEKRSFGERISRARAALSKESSR